MKTVEQRVIEVVAKEIEVEVDQVTLASSFEELGADSLTAIEIILAIENEFGKEVDDTQSPPRTVQEVVDYIKANWI